MNNRFRRASSSFYQYFYLHINEKLRTYSMKISLSLGSGNVVINKKSSHFVLCLSTLSDDQQHGRGEQWWGDTNHALSLQWSGVRRDPSPGTASTETWGLETRAESGELALNRRFSSGGHELTQPVLVSWPPLLSTLSCYLHQPHSHTRIRDTETLLSRQTRREQHCTLIINIVDHNNDSEHNIKCQPS